MNLFVEERDGGEIAFWADGDLQFDSADEAVYHELLALPALTLAQAALPHGRTGDGLRVLICGGGDGLALREVLRFPGVAHVDLVDYSADVVELGRTRFAPLNRQAFADSRAHVHIADAWEFLAEVTAPYDVILCDFTTPRRAEDTRVMTRDWYARVAGALAPNGVAGINAVSPQTTPEAFWCLRKTVRASGLNALPFRACIPSFRDQGYGTWAFLLAGHRRLRRADLKSIDACPVTETVTNLSAVVEMAAFSQAERRIEAHVPVHSLPMPCLLPLLLNPGGGARTSEAESLPLPALDGLLSSIPILHPYHTRIMVESLASQVVGSVQALDLRRLVDALLGRASELPAALRGELLRLRDFLTLKNAPHLSDWNLWAQRLFAIIVVIMTLANLVAPDNVFGKGSFGLGHASVSRSYSSSGRSFGRSSFSRSGPSGYAMGRRATGGSFGQPAAPSVSASRPSEPITGRGFRGGFQRGQPTDIFGNAYQPRTFVYIHGGGYGGYHSGGSYNNTSGGGSGGADIALETQQARFVADDDMMVMENGDVIITLSDTAFLVVSGGTVTLHDKGNPAPILSLYADPLLFENITTRLQGQRDGLQKEMTTRREWLQWVGWTGPLFSSVKGDESELAALEDLDKRLATALVRVGESAPKAPPPDLPEDQSRDAIELFSSAGLLTNGRVTLIDSTGRYLFTDGKIIRDGKPGPGEPVPPGLTNALAGVLAKLEKEFRADLTSAGSDLTALQTDKAALDKDLADYTALATANGADYEVDYGTDTMSASEAIRRTNADLAQNATDTAATAASQTTLNAQVNRIWTAADAFAAASKGARATP